MALSIPPGFGSAALVFSGAVGTAPYITTIGVDLSAAGGDFVAAANSVKSAFSQAFLPHLSNALSLDKCVLAVGQDGPGGSIDSDTSPYVGERNAAFPPTAMSTIGRKITNEIGRSGRGRMFIPGITAEVDVGQDGAISSEAREFVSSLMADFIDNLENPVAGSIGQVSVPPVLLHAKKLNALPPTPIVGMTCAPLVGWVRGRIR